MANKNFVVKNGLQLGADTQPTLSGDGSQLKIQTTGGYVSIGPDNSTWMHFSTDRGSFYFNKKITVNEGIVDSYDEDLQLRRAASTTARLRITAGTTISDQTFNVTGDLTTTGYLQATSYLYTRNNLRVLNAAGTGWTTWGTRNNGNYDLSVGTISSGNITTTGYLRGPSTFTIDPAAHGNDTGTLVIAGNLQVDGTTTTVNSTTVAVSDLNFTVAKDAANAAAANTAGLTVAGADAQLKYIATGDKWTMNKPLDVTGSITSTNADFANTLSGSFTVDNTSNSSKEGISLYGANINGSDAINPTYGMMFSGTAGSGTHGSVTGDWATYFTMNNSTGRGWIFRNQSTPTNVASISNTGNATFSGTVTASGGNSGNWNTAYTTANAALPKAGGALTGAVTTNSTFDGRNVSVDGTKLDTIATSANNYSFPYTVSASESNSTVVQRHPSGYIYANYYNGSGTFSTSGNTSGMGMFTGTNGSDTFGRPYTAAAARSLLNVENGATADQSSAEILNAITTVDGSGSGLDADLLDGMHRSNAFGVGETHSFSVGGDATKFYPVVISGGDSRTVMRVVIYRNYSDTAPSTWNTSTHKGGLTFDYEIRVGGWGGMSTGYSINYFGESYSTIAAKIAYVNHTMQHCVWLRGGTASYNLQTSDDVSITVYDDVSSGWTSGSGWVTYPNSNAAYVWDENYIDGVTAAQATQASTINPYKISNSVVGNGGLTEINFTSALNSKLSGIAASANNYVLPFTNNSTNWNTAYTVANAALPKAGGALTGAVTTNSTFDGRNVSVDGTKLDTIATSANNYSFPYTVSMVQGNSTIAQRNSSGYLHASYFNGTGTFSTSGADSGMGRFTGTNGSDTYGRSYSATGARALLNVENGATADQTAAQILAALKTVDVNGTAGINAGTFDALGSGSFLRSDAANTGALRFNTTEYDFTSTYNPSQQGTPMSIRLWDHYTQTSAPATYGQLLDLYGRSGHWRHQFHMLGTDTRFRYGTYPLATAGWSSWYTQWHSGNDGSGTGLDADLLDGQHGSYYAPASSIPSVGNGTLTINTSGSASGGGTFTANQSGNTTISISATDTTANQTITLSGAVTGSGTTSIVTTNPYQTSVSFSTNGPDSSMEYSQAASVTDTKIAPSTDWYNSIRMGHGDPYSYYGNTMAMKMTGTGSGTLYTQVISNNTAGGWNKYWHTGNDGSTSGLDADLLDGNHASAFLGVSAKAADSNLLDGIDSTYFNRGDQGYGVMVGTSGWNMNDLFTTRNRAGFFDVWSGTNFPPSTSHVHGMQVRHNSSAHYGWQLAGQYAQNKLWHRQVSNGTFGAWNQQWGSGNDGAGSGLDADLLDGNHASAFMLAGAAPNAHTHAYLPLAGGTLTGGLSGTTADFSGKVDFQGTAAIEGGTAGSGYGLFKGYSANYNHFMASRGIVTGSTASPTFNGGHQMTFVEYVANAADGFRFKSSNTGTYAEIAYINRVGISTIGTVTATGGNSTNWNTAYGWGNHASGGYLTAETVSSTNAVTITGTKYFKPAGTVASPLVGGGNASLQAYSVGGNYAAYMAFHRSGHYAINWGLDTSNNMILGGWSASTTVPRMTITTGTGLISSAGQGNLWGISNDGSGSGLDADLLDGLNLHNTQGTQNGANTVLRTQVNGYTMLGWINTTSGVASGAPTRIYCSQDSYIRYYTPASLAPYMENCASAVQIYTTQTAGTAGVHYPTFVSVNASGNKSLKYDPGMMYDPSTNILGDVNFKFKGTLTGSLVGNASTASSAPNASNLNTAYGVTAGAGNGLKFWNGSDAYKISMGTTAEYKYGPVTDYSIKTTIDSNSSTRGFTWGTNGAVPIAALNVGNGNMQIAGTFTGTRLFTSDGTNTISTYVSGSYNQIASIGSAAGGARDLRFNLGQSGTIMTINANKVQMHQPLLLDGAANTAQTSSNIISTQASDSSGATRYHLSFTKANGTTTLGRITTNNFSTTYTTSSDYRLKEDLVEITGATAKVLSIPTRNFRWIGSDVRTDGFLAHELATIVPDAVVGEKDGMTTPTLYLEGEELPEGVSVGDIKVASVPDYQSIDQSKLVPLLVKTIQELEARITALENA